MSKILYILSGNISHTPRALKSILTFAPINEVKIIGINRGGIWEQLDIDLIKQSNINYKSIPFERNSSLFCWLISKLIQLISSVLYKLNLRIPFIFAFSGNRASILLNLKLYQLKRQFNIIIGHSSGALYPVWSLSKKLKVPFIFDLEDYHPGEQINSDTFNEKRRREFLLKKLLPEASFVTVASPLIAERIKELVGATNLKNLAVINNCFPSSEFEFTPQDPHTKSISTSSHVLPRPSTSHIPRTTSISTSSHVPFSRPFTSLFTRPSTSFFSRPSTSILVHFVWFSQNIASNRGLEIIIPELIKVKDKIHLHLIGNLYDDFNQEWIVPNREFISTYPPVSQKELNRFICQFDVGLALELSSVDENRGICLTNKIWTYLQAGFYILATDTPAQIAFIEEHEGHGLVFDALTQRHGATEKMKYKSLEETLDYIVNNIEAIRNQKKERFERAKEYSWENESVKLVNIWDRVLNTNKI